MPYHQSLNSQDDYHYNIWTYTDQSFTPHFHKNLELVYVIRGALDCMINNISYRLTEGTFGLCLSYDIHSYNPDKDSLYWVLVFSEDFVRSFGEATHGKVGEAFGFRCSEQTHRFLLSQLIHQTPDTIFGFKSCLYAVCDEYLRQTPLTDKELHKKQLIRQVTDYVQEHHHQNLTLTDLSRLLGYDYHYLSRYFNAMFRISFSDFLNSYRLEHALRLLKESNQSITEIALESGFQSARNFNYFFRKSMGMSPTEYRKSYNSL